MGEPLSTALAVVPLLGAAIAVSSELLIYIGDVRHAPEYIKTTAESIETCLATLRQLRRMLYLQSSYSPNGDSYGDQSTLEQPLEEFEKACKKLRDAMRPCRLKNPAQDGTFAQDFVGDGAEAISNV